MYLITGYGSIGSLVVDYLLNNLFDYHGSIQIIVIDKDEKSIHKAHIKYKDDPRVDSLVADITVKTDIVKTFQKYDISHVIHTAAMKHVTFCEKSPVLATINNIIGVNNLLEVSASNKVEKFINVSTDKSAYPSNVMGATKFIAERTVLSYNYINEMRCQNVRLGNVLNSTGSLIPTIINIVENGLTLDLTDLEATRFFITPNDVCKFIVEMSEGKYRGDVVIKKLKSATLETMVNAVLELIGQKDYENIEIVGLRQGEKLHEHLYSGAELTNVADCGKYWSLYYSENLPPVELIDSSQFCVTKDEFLKILQSLNCY